MSELQDQDAELKRQCQPLVETLLGWHVGDVAIYRGQRFRITRVLWTTHKIDPTKPKTLSLTGLKGNPAKKSGGWGLLERRVFPMNYLSSADLMELQHETEGAP
jgi:hypothetical protein